MAMIICAECGNQISDKAISCPNCGCPREFFMESKDEKKILETITILGEKLEIDENLDEYIKLEKEFNITKRDYMELVEQYIDSMEDIDSLIDNMPEAISFILDKAIEVRIKILMSFGIYDIDRNEFFEKYFVEYFDTSVIVQPIIEEYMKIIGYEEELAEYRAFLNQNKTRWSGGGFGIKGALTGYVKAEMMNIGVDFVNSIKDHKRESEHNRIITQAKWDLYNDPNVKNSLLNAFYAIIKGTQDAMYHEMYLHGVVVKKEFDSSKAQRIVNNIEKNIKNLSRENTINSLKEAFLYDPFLFGIYKIAIENKLDDGACIMAEKLGMFEGQKTDYQIEQEIAQEKRSAQRKSVIKNNHTVRGYSLADLAHRTCEYLGKIRESCVNFLPIYIKAIEGDFAAQEAIIVVLQIANLTVICNQETEKFEVIQDLIEAMLEFEIYDEDYENSDFYKSLEALQGYFCGNGNVDELLDNINFDRCPVGNIIASALYEDSDNSSKSQEFVLKAMMQGELIALDRIGQVEETEKQSILQSLNVDDESSVEIYMLNVGVSIDMLKGYALDNYTALINLFEFLSEAIDIDYTDLDADWSEIISYFEWTLSELREQSILIDRLSDTERIRFGIEFCGTHMEECDDEYEYVTYDDHMFRTKFHNVCKVMGEITLWEILFDKCKAYVTNYGLNLLGEKEIFIRESEYTFDSIKEIAFLSEEEKDAVNKIVSYLWLFNKKVIGEPRAIKHIRELTNCNLSIGNKDLTDDKEYESDLYKEIINSIISGDEKQLDCCFVKRHDVYQFAYKESRIFMVSKIALKTERPDMFLKACDAIRELGKEIQAYDEVKIKENAKDIRAFTEICYELASYLENELFNKGYVYSLDDVTYFYTMAGIFGERRAVERVIYILQNSVVKDCNWEKEINIWKDRLKSSHIEDAFVRTINASPIQKKKRYGVFECFLEVAQQICYGDKDEIKTFLDVNTKEKELFNELQSMDSEEKNVKAILKFDEYTFLVTDNYICTKNKSNNSIVLPLSALIEVKNITEANITKIAIYYYNDKKTYEMQFPLCNSSKEIDCSTINKYLEEEFSFRHGDYYRYGIHYEQDLAKALELYKVYVAKHKEEVDIYRAIGETFIQKGEFEKGIDNLCLAAEKGSIRACAKVCEYCYKKEFVQLDEKHFMHYKVADYAGKCIDFDKREYKGTVGTILKDKAWMELANKEKVLLEKGSKSDFASYKKIENKAEEVLKKIRVVYRDVCRDSQGIYSGIALYNEEKKDSRVREELQIQPDEEILVFALCGLWDAYSSSFAFTKKGIYYKSKKKSGFIRWAEMSIDRFEANSSSIKFDGEKMHLDYEGTSIQYIIKFICHPESLKWIDVDRYVEEKRNGAMYL